MRSQTPSRSGMRRMDEAAVLTDRLEGLRSRLTEARRRGDGCCEGTLAAAQAELVSMLGPALPDGKHFGALIAVGADQQPPRLVIDIEQWFTDQAARTPRSRTAYHRGTQAPMVSTSGTRTRAGG